MQKGRTEWDCLHLAAEQLNRMYDRPILYALNEAEGTLNFRIEPEDEKSILTGLNSEDIGVAKWYRRTISMQGQLQIRCRTRMVVVLLSQRSARCDGDCGNPHRRVFCPRCV